MTRALGLGVTIAVVAAVVALLNVEPASPAAAECKGTSSGGGPSSTPSATPSSSPSEDDDPLPIPTNIIPEDEEDSPSATPSSTQPPGEAEGQVCPTSVSIKTGRSRQTSTATTFKGNVKSPESDCERGRKVTLKKRKKGRDATAGTDVAKRNGSWKVQVRKARGRYYAVAPKSKVGDTTCKRGKSKAIRP